MSISITDAAYSDQPIEPQPMTVVRGGDGGIIDDIQVPIPQ